MKAFINQTNTEPFDNVGETLRDGVERIGHNVCVCVCVWGGLMCVRTWGGGGGGRRKRACRRLCECEGVFQCVCVCSNVLLIYMQSIFCLTE